MPRIDSAANPMDEVSYQAVRADELLWRARKHSISRRRLFQWVAMGASSVLLPGGWLWHPRGAQAASPGDLVLKPTPSELFFDYGSNKEMRWEQMYQRGYVVPNAQFFVAIIPVPLALRCRPGACVWRDPVSSARSTSPMTSC